MSLLGSKVMGVRDGGGLKPLYLRRGEMDTASCFFPSFLSPVGLFATAPLVSPSMLACPAKRSSSSSSWIVPSFLGHGLLIIHQSENEIDTRTRSPGSAPAPRAAHWPAACDPRPLTRHAAPTPATGLAGGTGCAGKPAAARRGPRMGPGVRAGGPAGRRRIFRMPYCTSSTLVDKTVARTRPPGAHTPTHKSF
jgi:hypothetical protein